MRTLFYCHCGDKTKGNLHNITGSLMGRTTFQEERPPLQVLMEIRDLLSGSIGPPSSLGNTLG